MMYLELPISDPIVGAMFPFYLFWYFSAFFPYSFSGALIIKIAPERMFIITKTQVYKKYITIKVLYQIIVFCLILNFVLIVFYIIERILQPNFHVVPFILLSAEIYFIFITIVAHIYIFHSAQSKSQKITNKRHCGINFNKKLMMTIA